MFNPTALAAAQSIGPSMNSSHRMFQCTFMAARLHAAHQRAMVPKARKLNIVIPVLIPYCTHATVKTSPNDRTFHSPSSQFSEFESSLGEQAFIICLALGASFGFAIPTTLIYEDLGHDYKHWTGLSTPSGSYVELCALIVDAA
jgi:hypothetical protein